jgi:hypothetical protein
MKTDAKNKKQARLQSVMAYLYTFIQNLDYTAADEIALRMNYAMRRISALEREVGELKAQQSGVGALQEEPEASVGELPLFNDRLPA